jgi:hypothetical protein
MTTSVGAIPAETVGNSYQLRPTFWNCFGILIGLSMLAQRGGGVVLGLILIIVSIAFWKARKVTLGEKSLVLNLLMRSRTVPYSKIESVDMGRGLLGSTVRLSGTGTTKTILAPFSGAQELHDRICVAMER